MREQRTPDAENGFTLVELLIAIPLVTLTLVSLAQLFTLSVAATSTAGSRTLRSLLAAQKAEELRGGAYGYDERGLAITEMVPSPPRSLDESTAGFVDYADGFGRSSDPAHAVYTRRWSIQPDAADPANTLVMQVRVITRRDDAVGRGAGTGDDVRVIAARTRKRR